MACDADDFDKNIENLKSTVKASFADLYASLKARELKTLRQLDAIRKQCEDNKELSRSCLQNIHINYDNECTILDNIRNYGAIDLEKLNFDSNIFTLEDYVSPNDDHMYCYKTIEDLTKSDNLEAIEEAALKKVTFTDNCICNVNIRTEEVSKQFREEVKNIVQVETSIDNEDSLEDSVENEEMVLENGDDKSDSSDSDLKKMQPTEDWMNSIKSQTETEPTQSADVMEHSTISCS